MTIRQLIIDENEVPDMKRRGIKRWMVRIAIEMGETTENRTDAGEQRYGRWVWIGNKLLEVIFLARRDHDYVFSTHWIARIAKRRRHGDTK